MDYDTDQLKDTQSYKNMRRHDGLFYLLDLVAMFVPDMDLNVSINLLSQFHLAVPIQCTLDLRRFTRHTPDIDKHTHIYRHIYTGFIRLQGSRKLHLATC